MDTREQGLLRLTAKAIDLSPGEREELLWELQSTDPELGRRLAAILREHEEGTSILDQPRALTSLITASPRDNERRAPLLEPGTVLCDRFEIVGLLGVGGMGTAYRASDRELRISVALKVVDLSADELTADTRFRREIHIARQVTHPNVCRVYDFFCHREGSLDIPFLTMELVEGPTLGEYLRRTGTLSEEEALPIARQVAAALDAAHRAGVVHRDLKPSNIIMEERPEGPRAVVTDFGLARSSDPDTAPSITSPQEVTGTPSWMAPEQLKNGPTTTASDVYAFGLLLYRLVTGRLPFDGESVIASALQRIEAPPRSPRDHVADLDKRWEKAILSALERDPQCRPSSAGAVVTLLERRERLHVSRRVAMAASVLILVLSLLAGLWFTRSPHRPDPATPQSVPETGPVTVLVAEFDNATGNPLLDGTLRYALSRELVGSPRLRVASTARVGDALVLMRAPADTPVTAAHAREIALRDGGIDLVILGRAERFGKMYLLSAEAQRAADGEVLTVAKVEARSEEEVLDVVQKMADELRDTLVGTTEPASGTIFLPRVTTRSLRALQLYAQADARMAPPRDAQAAEQLLRRAIEIDPEFASAWILLAYAVRNSPEKWDESLEYAEKAMSLTHDATDVEAYFIRGTAYHFRYLHSLEREDLAKSAAMYRALLDLEPDHFWASGNLAIVYARLGTREEAVPYLLRLSELRPNHMPSQIRALGFLQMAGPEHLQTVLARAHSLMQNGISPSTLGIAVVAMAETTIAWRERRIADGIEALERARPQIEGIDEPQTRDMALSILAPAYFWFGRIDDADVIIQSLDGDARRYALPHLFSVRNDRESLRQYYFTDRGPVMLARIGLLPVTLARAGLLDEARRLLQDDLSPMHRGLGEAAIAFAEGTPEEAARLFERWRPDTEPDQVLYFSTTRNLAEAYHRSGDADQAARLLEEAYAQRSELSPASYVMWLRIALRLVQVSRELGHEERASIVEADLRSHLTHADPDFWILRQLDDGSTWK